MRTSLFISLKIYSMFLDQNLFTTVTFWVVELLLYGPLRTALELTLEAYMRKGNHELGQTFSPGGHTSAFLRVLRTFVLQTSCSIPFRTWPPAPKPAASKKGKATANSPLFPDALLDGLKEFEVSDSMVQNLEDLVIEGVLPSQSLIEWHAPSADECPSSMLTSRSYSAGCLSMDSVCHNVLSSGDSFTTTV